MADSVRNCHTEVALISTTGVCTTRTLYRFIYEHPGGEEFEATLLERTAECPKAATVAVIGVDAEAVSLISPKHDLSPLPKDTESKARRLLDLPEADSQERHKEVGMDLSDALPEVLRVGHVTMLSYRLKGGRGDGPTVIYLNDKLFRLEGWCTTGHLFFSVYNKLFLCYTRFCCVCGEVIFYFYDLSAKAPKIVYENGKFSD